MNLVAAHTINILLQPTQLILLQGTLLEDTSCSYQIKYNSFPCETPQFLALARKRPKYKTENCGHSLPYFSNLLVFSGSL